MTIPSSIDPASPRPFASLPSTPVKQHSEPSADLEDPSAAVATLNSNNKEGSSQNLLGLPSTSTSSFTLELSECGVHLYSMLGISPKQVLRVFESHRVHEEIFRVHGAQLMSSPVSDQRDLVASL